MENYINDLLHNFRDTFDMQYITFETALDTVHLDEAQAVSVGLILNEAITNAIKYAFASNQKGIIVIEMKPSENNIITLKIRDNGNGFPQRNLILFITFIVILLTLLIQGLTLPYFIKKIK